MNQQRVQALADYKIFMDYNFKIMNKNDIGKCISQVNQFESKLKSGKTISSYDDDELEAIGLENFKNFLIIRIEKFFVGAVTVLSSEFSFWECYIKYCKTNIPNKVSEIYRNCLDIHGNRPALWCDALWWEYEFTANDAHLCKLFIEATMVHPKSEEIVTTFFGIVLKEFDEMIPGDLCRVMYNSCTLDRLFDIYNNTTIKSTSFKLSLLKQCEYPKYCEVTAPIQKKILLQLTSTDSLSEEVWDALAQRELCGLSMCDLEKILSPLKKKDNGEAIITNPLSEKLICKEFIIDKMVDKIWEDRPLERRIELCVVTYKTAVREVKSKRMMEMYINAMLNLNEDMNELPQLKRDELIYAFKQGHDMRLLTEHHYYVLVQMFGKCESTLPLALDVLPIAIEQYNSSKLYQLWISCFILQNEESQVQRILRLASRNLKMEDRVEIWEMAIGYYRTLGRKYAKTCQSLLKEACRHIHPSFGIFRIMYLDWCIAYLEIEKTRIQYDTMCEFPPPTLGLHKKMQEIEFNTFKRNEERLRICYENAIRDFGKENLVVWIDYIKHEMKQGNWGNVTRLLKRAYESLKPDQYEIFKKTFKRIFSMG